MEGKKFDGGKPRWDLVPKSMEEVVHVFTMGAEKYEDRNWEKGMSWHRIFRAMITHAFAWWWGSKRHEKGMHHLGSVAWCALALMEFENTHPELDDRPYGGAKEPIEGYSCVACGAPFHVGSLMYRGRDRHGYYCSYCKDK